MFVVVIRFLDQQRLNSLDRLFHRSLEFHNNIHNFKATSIPPISSVLTHGDANKNCDDTVGLKFYQLPKGASGLCGELNGTVMVSELRNFLSKVPQNDIDGILWLHIKELKVLQPIAEHFAIHELCWTHFFDLRAHSNAVAVSDALSVSICTLQMQNDKSRLYKVYGYVSSGLFISFERELIPDVISEDELKDSDTESLVSEALEKRISNIAQLSKTLGGTYILYELVMECLVLSNPVLEYLSRSVYYLRQQVHKRQTYTQRKAAHRQIHILLSVSHMLDRHISEWTREVTSFLLKTSIVHGLLDESLVSSAHRPFFHDMADSYSYRSLCLKNVHTDLRTVLETLESIVNIRSQQTSVNLSLVATVFLPITFLAGVFGMNFVKYLLHQKYYVVLTTII